MSVAEVTVEPGLFDRMGERYGDAWQGNPLFCVRGMDVEEAAAARTRRASCRTCT